MVAKGLEKYINVVDKNGQKIGEWAEDKGDSKASCKICREGGGGAIINFKKGKDPLIDHSDTEKHRRYLRKSKTQNRQISLKDALRVFILFFIIFILLIFRFRF